MADNIQHEDFGEKIGGAKKDLWKDRGLYVNDLDAMNEREAEKFVKKDNIWKKPDYQAMLDDGIPLGVVYFIKKARDGLNASPQYYRRDDTPEKRLARQKEYIQTVRELQSVVSEVRTVEDAMQVYDRFFVENGYLEQVQGWGSGIHYQATEKGRENPAITNKLSNTLMVRSAGYFERNFTQKAQKEQFGVSKDQKVPKGYAIHFNDGKNTYSKNNDWKLDTWYVTKGYSILQTNFETREAALKWVQELAKGRSKSGKTRFVPPQLIAVRRTGPDYRNGAEIEIILPSGSIGLAHPPYSLSNPFLESMILIFDILLMNNSFHLNVQLVRNCLFYHLLNKTQQNSLLPANPNTFLFLDALASIL